MAGYNRVILMGNLTRDPEIQYTAGGTARARFGIAVNRIYNDRQTGERKEEVCFVNITAFGRTAEICQEYLQKGSLVFLEGRLNYYAYETESGEKRSSLSVVADAVQLMPRGTRIEDGSSDRPAAAADTDASPEDDIPF